MKIDVRNLYTLMSKSERRSFEIKIIARLKRLLVLCEQCSRVLRKKDPPALSLKTLLAALHAITEEEAEQLAEQLINRTYFTGLWFASEWERERKDVITVLAAILPPDVTPFGLPSRWDLEAIDEIVASRRARELSDEPAKISAEMPTEAAADKVTGTTAQTRQPNREKQPRRGDAPGLRDAVETALRELGRPGTNGSTWKLFTERVWASCGVEPEQRRYGTKTIQRLVDKLDIPRKVLGQSVV